MALSKAMSAVTCPARHSMLLEARPRSCLSAAGRVTGALSPAARPRRRGAPSRRTPLLCRTGGCGPRVPPQCPSVPKPRKGAGEGRGSRSTGGDWKSGSAARGSRCQGLGLPGRCRPAAAAARGSSGGTEGRGRDRDLRPPPLRHLPGLTPGAEARAVPRPRQDSP